MYQSSAYLGIMHGFRLSTEDGTRKALGNDPLGYFDALGSMHGWSDGDGYYENYLGHPIQALSLTTYGYRMIPVTVTSSSVRAVTIG